MSKGNGQKQFIYMVLWRRRSVRKWYLIRSDHDPSMEELIGHLHLPKGGTIDVQRYDLDAIPKLPPKGWTHV